MMRSYEQSFSDQIIEKYLRSNKNHRRSITIFDYFDAPFLIKQRGRRHPALLMIFNITRNECEGYKMNWRGSSSDITFRLRLLRKKLVYNKLLNNENVP